MPPGRSRSWCQVGCLWEEVAESEEDCWLEPPDEGMPELSERGTLVCLPGNELRPPIRLRTKTKVVIPRLRKKTFSPLCLSQARAALQFGASQRQLHN